MKPPLFLLHGLARSRFSMQRPARLLRSKGRRVENLGYPSTFLSIDTLAESLYRRLPEGPVDFLTHSLGGILLRRMLKLHSEISLGRVVMLAPPNRGSAFARYVMPRLGFLFGPAGRQLQDPAWIEAHCASPPGLVIIAGTRSEGNLNALLGRRFLEPPHDGTVSVQETQLDAMEAFHTVPASHTWIMRHPQSLELILKYLG